MNNKFTTESGKDSSNIKKITANKQEEYNNCLKKIDTLIEMRFNGEVTQQEFMDKKAMLVREKDKANEILNDTNQRVDEWLKKAETILSFARDARTNFGKGTLQQKREILSVLGSNLLLKDKILTISIQKPLILVEKAADEVRAIKHRLEPVIIYQNSFNFEQEYAQSASMLRW